MQQIEQTLVEKADKFGEINSTKQNFLLYKKLFNNSDVFPYLFTLINSNVDYIESKMNNYGDNKEFYNERECQILFLYTCCSDLYKYAIPHVFSTNDYRHEITREIQFASLGCELADFSNFENYSKIYKKLPKNYMKSFYSEKNGLKYFNSIHLSALLYHCFEIVLNDDDIKRLGNSPAKNIASIALPDFMHLLIGYNKKRRDIYKDVTWLKNIIKKGIKADKKELFKNIVDKYSLEWDVLYNSIAMMILFAGGGKVILYSLQRFIQNPKKEYKLFKSNPNNYILEATRLNAQIVRAVSNLSTKPQEYSINGKKYLIPIGTPMGLPFSFVNDNEKYFGDNATKFNVNDSKDYHKAISFHAKDGIFNTGNVKDLTKRFCPGRVIIETHCIELIDNLFQNILQIKK